MLKNMEDMNSKGIWLKYILDEQIQRITKGRSQLPDNLKVWQKIASQSDDQNMMSIACNALTQYVDETSKSLIESKLKSESVNREVKKAIITGLNSNEPDYAASLLLKTYDDWQNYGKGGLEYEAFSVFARQPIDSNSYKFLKEIILDENEPDRIRKVAISSLFVAHDPNDYVAVLKDVLNNSSSIIVRREAAFLHGNLPRNSRSITRPILQNVLETETDPYIIEQCIRVVGLPKNSDVILSHMEQLLKQENLPEETVRSAKDVILRIKEMKK